MKYYLTRDTSRPILINDRKYAFEACDWFEPTHSWWGVYATEDEVETADLDAAAAKGMCKATTKADYDYYQVKKKTAKRSANLIDFGIKHSPQFTAPSGKPVEVVEEPRSAEPRAPVEAETLDEVLTPKKGRR